MFRGGREALRSLTQSGFCDTFRLHHHETGLFSWWDYRMLAFPKNRGLRIDAVLAAGVFARNARLRESIARCGKGRSHPITRRSGQSLPCEHSRKITAARNEPAGPAAHDLGRLMRFLSSLDQPLAHYIGSAVEFATSEEVADRFKEIPASEFERAVVFVRPDGVVFSGAEAVWRSLAYRPSKRWLEWSYDHVAGFAAISEFCYRVIAHNRMFASALTRLFWGKDARVPTYFWARSWFLRLLGLVYLIAFVSLWTQIDGLIGANGILPVSQFLPAVQEQLGQRAYSILPTLCWFNSSNAFLHFLCGGGALLSLLLMAGIAPAVMLLGLFVLYLSLAIAGQTFLGFHWDTSSSKQDFFQFFWRRGGSSPKHLRRPAFPVSACFFRNCCFSSSCSCRAW